MNLSNQPPTVALKVITKHWSIIVDINNIGGDIRLTYYKSVTLQIFSRWNFFPVGYVDIIMSLPPTQNWLINKAEHAIKNMHFQIGFIAMVCFFF